MPCYDSRDDEDRVRNEKHANAFAAILCGVLNGNEQAKAFAEHWHNYHVIVDALRETVRFDHDSPPLMEALEKCNEVLDEAHAALVGSYPHKHKQ